MSRMPKSSNFQTDLFVVCILCVWVCSLDVTSEWVCPCNLSVVCVFVDVLRAVVRMYGLIMIVCSYRISGRHNKAVSRRVPWECVKCDIPESWICSLLVFVCGASAYYMHFAVSGADSWGRMFGVSGGTVFCPLNTREWRRIMSDSGLLVVPCVQHALYCRSVSHTWVPDTCSPMWGQAMRGLSDRSTEIPLALRRCVDSHSIRRLGQHGRTKACVWMCDGGNWSVGGNGQCGMQTAQMSSLQLMLPVHLILAEIFRSTVESPRHSFWYGAGRPMVCYGWLQGTSCCGYSVHTRIVIYRCIRIEALFSYMWWFPVVTFVCGKLSPCVGWLCIPSGGDILWVCVWCSMYDMCRSLPCLHPYSDVRMLWPYVVGADALVAGISGPPLLSLGSLLGRWVSIVSHMVGEILGSLACTFSTGSYVRQCADRMAVSIKVSTEYPAKIDKVYGGGSLCTVGCLGPCTHRGAASCVVGMSYSLIKDCDAVFLSLYYYGSAA